MEKNTMNLWYVERLMQKTPQVQGFTLLMHNGVSCVTSNKNSPRSSKCQSPLGTCGSGAWGSTCRYNEELWGHLSSSMSISQWLWVKIPSTKTPLLWSNIWYSYHIMLNTSNIWQGSRFMEFSFSVRPKRSSRTKLLSHYTPSLDLPCSSICWFMRFLEMRVSGIRHLNHPGLEFLPRPQQIFLCLRIEKLPITHIHIALIYIYI